MFPKSLTNDYPVPIEFVSNAIKTNKLANSYILISKNTDDTFLFIKELSKILNCLKSPFTSPCKECLNCKWLDKNEHPQALIIIKADEDSKKGQIKIESIRELLNTIQNTSEFFRVIFFEASDLNTLPPESCNLLLKTIEESPAKTLFLFANKSKNNILPTILSRSQIIYLSKKDDSLLKSQIENSEITQCFSKDIKSALSKSKLTLEFINDHKIDLLEHFNNISLSNYEKYKISNQKDFLKLYETIISSNKKLKSFIQPRFVVEDFFLNLTD